MSLLERLLFWIAIIVLIIAVIGEKSKLSALEAQAEKAKNINQVYVGEDEGDEEGDEDENSGEEEESDESSEDEGDEGENEGGEE